MAKPHVYRFPGSPTDVIVVLSESDSAERAVENPQVAAAGHAGIDESDHEDRNMTTEFHLWSTVLKEQSKYFEADILRWSETKASPELPANPWRYVPSHVWRPKYVLWTDDRHLIIDGIAHQSIRTGGFEVYACCVVLSNPEFTGCYLRSAYVHWKKLTCIDNVGPPAYAKAFQVMYEAHYGETAHTLSRTVVRSVKSALDLLWVASHLQFSTGVDTALLYIQAVPWTADEEASVAECIDLLQVPMSKGLDARLKTDGGAMRFNREAVRGALLVAWNKRLVRWRDALRKDFGLTLTHSVNRLIEAVVDVRDSMFELFGSAASLGVGDTLLESLVKNDVFPQIRGYDPRVSYEAILLVLLRIMRALSEGEVVCNDELKESMVHLCVTAFTGCTYAIQESFSPDAKYSRSPQLSYGGNTEHAVVLKTYLKTYESQKSLITRDLATNMGLVLSSLDYSKRLSAVTQLMEKLPHTSSNSSPNSYVYLDEIVTTLIATSKVCIHRPTVCR